MSILTGDQILTQRQYGNIVIEPFDEACLNPNSYNVHLYHELLIIQDEELDLKVEPVTLRVTIPDSGLRLIRNEMYLGATVETIGSDKYRSAVDGRSTAGRYGFQVHITAGFGDVGFCGAYTLEMVSLHRNLRVYKGAAIAQVYFETVEGLTRLMYKGIYAGHRGPRGPKPLVF